MAKVKPLSPRAARIQEQFLARLMLAGYIAETLATKDHRSIRLTDKGARLMQLLIELEADLDGIGKDEAVHLVALVYFFKKGQKL